MRLTYNIPHYASGMTGSQRALSKVAVRLQSPVSQLFGTRPLSCRRASSSLPDEISPVGTSSALLPSHGTSAVLLPNATSSTGLVQFSDQYSQTSVYEALLVFQCHRYIPAALYLFWASHLECEYYSLGIGASITTIRI